MTARPSSLAAVAVTALALAPTGSAGQVGRDSAYTWNQSAAADYLDSRQEWWRSWPSAARDHDTQCVSCHTSLPYALARPVLSAVLHEAGTPVPEAGLLADVRKRVRLWNEVQPFYPDQTQGLPKTSQSRGTEAVLNALILANRDATRGRLSDATRTAFDHMWALQFTRGEERGAWAWLHFDLAPWESDGAAYFGAALAAVAVGVAPESYASAPEIQEPLDLLRAYLRTDAESRRPYDRVMLLWASAEISGLMTEVERRALIDDLSGMQNPDGGWSLASLGEWTRQDGTARDESSDGYATGLMAFALQRAGVAPTHLTLASALSWLVANQDPETGQWHASSLNLERDPTSDRGRFMSDAATAFAVLALSGG